MLNLTHPESVPTTQSLWKKFLPWFYTKTVHIGADEYDKAKVVTTRALSTSLLHTSTNSPESPRVFGELSPQKAGPMSLLMLQSSIGHSTKAILGLTTLPTTMRSSIRIWKYTLCQSGRRTQSLDEQLIFTGNTSGGPFAPNILDPRNGTNNPPRNAPGIQGHIALLWNDFEPIAST